jgi:hypothetical protein
LPPSRSCPVQSGAILGAGKQWKGVGEVAPQLWPPRFPGHIYAETTGDGNANETQNAMEATPFKQTFVARCRR